MPPDAIGRLSGTVTVTNIDPDRAAPDKVVVLADDLIWSSRLVAAAGTAGGAPEAVSSPTAFARAVEAGAAAVIVDLGGRTYDGVAQVRRAAQAGCRVIAVAQHDDLPLRRQALEAGARRVFSYNKLFHDGPRMIEALLAEDP
jgi:DNA-binding NarL/FixJ family response regulator